MENTTPNKKRKKFFLAIFIVFIIIIIAISLFFYLNIKKKDDPKINDNSTENLEKKEEEIKNNENIEKAEEKIENNKENGEWKNDEKNISLDEELENDEKRILDISKAYEKLATLPLQNKKLPENDFFKKNNIKDPLNWKEKNWCVFEYLYEKISDNSFKISFCLEAKESEEKLKNDFGNNKNSIIKYSYENNRHYFYFNMNTETLLETYEDYQKSARDTKRMTDLQYISVLIQMYFSENKYLPDSIEDTKIYLEPNRKMAKDPMDWKIKDGCVFKYLYEKISDNNFRLSSCLESEKNQEKLKNDWWIYPKRFEILW